MKTRFFKVIHWIGTLLILHVILAGPLSIGLAALVELNREPPIHWSEIKCAERDYPCVNNRNFAQHIEEAAEAIARKDAIAKGRNPDDVKAAEPSFFERIPDGNPKMLWPEVEVYVGDWELSYPQIGLLAYICGFVIAYIGTGRLTLLPWRVR
jgi:hypothetical protein